MNPKPKEHEHTVVPPQPAVGRPVGVRDISVEADQSACKAPCWEATATFVSQEKPSIYSWICFFFSRVIFLKHMFVPTYNINHHEKALFFLCRYVFVLFLNHPTSKSAKTSLVGWLCVHFFGASKLKETL